MFTFYSWGYLDVSVPPVRPRPSRVPRSPAAGCPIRTSADLRAFAPPRGFSQLITSFFASESQGIPHAPFPHSVFLKETAAGKSRLPVLCLRAVENTSLLVYSGCSLFLVIYVASLITRSTRFHDVNVLFLVENNGFEPMTPCLQSRCSSQLS